MLPKLNLNSRFIGLRTIRAMLTVVACVCLYSAAGFCAEVPTDIARLVAQGVLQHHEALFGHWNGSSTPTLGESTIVRSEGETVAYNFQVRPSGHVLVIVDDDLSPVPLYSTISTFVPGRSDNPNTMEAWIVPELKGRVRSVRQVMSRAGNSTIATAQSVIRRRVRQTWDYFEGLADGAAAEGTSRSLSPASGDIVRGAVLGPLLTTAWDQDAPYNLLTPADGCTHTLTGCVATAWAQLLNYWKWPVQGQGSHGYDWVGPSGSETLTVDFSAATYDWANMPAGLTASSSQTQKDAVSLLVYHLGVATETDFGCSISSSSLWADEVLDSYFKYKTLTQQANRLERENYNASQWFDLFKTELDADPPRPVIFTIGSAAGWHEVLVDGYQQGTANMVHVNFGWEGSYDGYYNVNDDSDFNTGAFDWYVNDNQLMVVGIEPDNPPPSVDAGSDQSVNEETEVQLSGSATDPAPDSTGISSYLWTQASGPEVVINNATAAAATITTPNVHSETQLVFQLRAEDANRAHGTDTVTITVSNSDGSVAPSAPASASAGGGSSGGCFMLTAIH
jgi:hypothetical protein